jgi:hypothetical protein
MFGISCLDCYRAEALLKTQMKKTIVYILSTPYAGSHYLSLLLGSHSRSLHLGELKNICWTRTRESREWKLNRGTILHDLGPEHIEDIYKIIFSRIDPEKSVLVDASKRFRWAAQFLGDNSHEKKFIHLIRDPRALARRYGLGDYLRKNLRNRWKIFRKLPSARAQCLFGPTDLLSSYLWLLQNREIAHFLQSNRLDFSLVTYRDLAVNTTAEVSRLMNWIGLEFEPAQLQYWNQGHIGTEKKNYEWIKQEKKSYFDLRWQKEIPSATQKRITEDALITDYLSSISLFIREDGLTRSNPDALRLQKS